MHIAETRAQAEADMAHGTLRLLRYTTKLGGIEPEYARSHDAALDAWVNKGIATFGKITLGTPDDAIAAIEAMREHSGGFGCFLLLAHNCANWEATRRSYELIARYVMPAVNRANAPRHASIDWASANAPRFIGAMVGAIGSAIAQHEQERSERGGKGIAWGNAAGSFIPDGKN
jgi:limonene 1,2-monooxygenase